MLGRDPYMRIGSLGLDQKIIRYVNICRTSLQAHNRHKVVMYLHGVAEQLEKFGLYMAEKIVLRFSHVRDIAIGKDIQKNKGHIAFKGILKRLID